MLCVSAKSRVSLLLGIMLGGFAFGDAQQTSMPAASESQAGQALVEFVEPTAEQQEEQARSIEAAMKAASELLNDKEFNAKIDREKAALASQKDMSLGSWLDVDTLVPDTTPDLDLKSILDGVEKQMTEAPPLGSDMPFALVSFSMPDAELKAVLRDLAKIGSGAVLRGLYKNEFTATVKRISSLVDEDEHKAGFGVDPTVFERFDVHRVPTFILPLAPIQPCTPAGCPIPAYVKASGAVSLEYFLEAVARAADNSEEKQAAERWLEKLK